MEESTIGKLFVPYKESLELKELGFDEPCISWFSIFGKFSNDYSTPKKYNSEFKISGGYISAPTFSQAFRWFRNKYKLPSHIATYWQHDWNNYSYQYYFVQDKVEWNDIEHYKTYEEAELACLKKLIEIVKKI